MCSILVLCFTININNVLGYIMALKIIGDSMGKIKDLSQIDIDKYNLSSHNTAYSQGYIQFLEQALEESEAKVQKLEKLISITLNECVECFKPLPVGEIVCAICQDELDGRWDHLRE